MAQTFFTSDTHFSHANIAQYTGRPFEDVNTMNDALVAAWNTTVAPDDIVWHLGDLAMGLLTESLPITATLNGIKRLVPGNHDRCWSGDKRAERSRTMYEDAGFEIMDEQVNTHIGDPVTGYSIPVRLCHFPYIGDSQDTDRYLKHRPEDDGTVLIHGHVHTAWAVRHSPNGTPMINVGVDAGWGFEPLPESKVAAIISGRVAIPSLVP